MTSAATGFSASSVDYRIKDEEKGLRGDKQDNSLLTTPPARGGT